MKLTIDTEQKTLVCETATGREQLPLYSDRAFDLLAEQGVKVGWNQRYPYTFSWFGRPIIQLPEDMVRTQEVIYRVKPDVILEEKCPTCESNLVLKTGRFGEFTACGNYPACKYVKQKTIGVKCPECSEGDIVERRSKRGKTFYGCHRYPDCEFVGWAKPVVEPCPECGSPYMTEKFLKSGAFLVCPNAECKYKKDMPVTEEVAITV